jgi:hypothetical protein
MLVFLLIDGRIRIREAQILTDPTDPDSRTLVCTFRLFSAESTGKRKIRKVSINKSEPKH